VWGVTFLVIPAFFEGNKHVQQLYAELVTYVQRYDKGLYAVIIKDFYELYPRTLKDLNRPKQKFLRLVQREECHAHLPGAVTQ